MAILWFLFFVFGNGLTDDVVLFEEEDVVAKAINGFEVNGCMWGD